MYESSMIHHDFSFGTSCISYIICVGSSQHLVIRNHRSQALRTHIWHFSAFPVLRVDASKFRKGSLQHLCFCVLIRSLFSSRLWRATSANLCSFRLIFVHRTCAHCKNNRNRKRTKRSTQRKTLPTHPIVESLSHPARCSKGAVKSSPA